MSDSLWPHGRQHARLPCPSLTPRACSNSCPLSHGCHPTISSSVVPFSFHLQSVPASGSFPMSQFFESTGLNIGVPASPSVLPMDIQEWSPLGWTDWISLQSKGLSRVFSNTTIQKHQFFSAQLSLWSNSHIHTCEKLEFKAKASLWVISRGAKRKTQGWCREGVEQCKSVFLRSDHCHCHWSPHLGKHLVRAHSNGCI